MIDGFELPASLSADAPPEARGLAREQVRLLAACPSGLRHARFADLPDLLEPGDLLVVNTSATLAAAIDAHRPDGRRVVVHVSPALAAGGWVLRHNH